MLKHCLFALLALGTFLAPIAASQADGLNSEDFIRQVQAFLRDQASGLPGEARVLVTPPQIDRLAPCADSEAFLPSAGRLRSRLTVGIRCLAPQRWVSYTQAELSVDGQYYVAAHSLDPGSVLTLQDVSVREGDLLRLAPGTVLDADRLIGSITTQRIGTGSPIRERALRSADSIARGQAVRLEARGVGFVATTDGTALQGGEPGTQIQVRAASGQTVSGTVLNGHTVLVLM